MLLHSRLMLSTLRIVSVAAAAQQSDHGAATILSSFLLRTDARVDVLIKAVRALSQIPGIPISGELLRVASLVLHQVLMLLRTHAAANAFGVACTQHVAGTEAGSVRSHPHLLKTFAEQAAEPNILSAEPMRRYVASALHLIPIIAGVLFDATSSPGASFCEAVTEAVRSAMSKSTVNALVPEHGLGSLKHNLGSIGECSDRGTRKKEGWGFEAGAGNSASPGIDVYAAQEVLSRALAIVAHECAQCMAPRHGHRLGPKSMAALHMSCSPAVPDGEGQRHGTLPPLSAVVAIIAWAVSEREDVLRAHAACASVAPSLPSLPLNTLRSLHVSLLEAFARKPNVDSDSMPDSHVSCSSDSLRDRLWSAREDLTSADLAALVAGLMSSALQSLAERAIALLEILESAMLILSSHIETYSMFGKDAVACKRADAYPGYESQVPSMHGFMTAAMSPMPPLSGLHAAASGVKHTSLVTTLKQCAFLAPPPPMSSASESLEMVQLLAARCLTALGQSSA